MRAKDMLNKDLKVINLGLDSFASVLENRGVETIHVDWKPPAQGDLELLDALVSLESKKKGIDLANQKALETIINGQPVWIDVRPASETIPGFTEKTILHAGPPVVWEKMCGPMKGAVIGALIYEGRAKDKDEALAVAGSGEYTFMPCHHLNAVGPMSGVISPSMPVMVVENRTTGNRSYSNFNSEKNRKALSFGAYDHDVQDILAWQRDVMAPALAKAVRELGGVDLKAITARALQMGDDCHNRHLAATATLQRELMPVLAKLPLPAGHLAELAAYMKHNDWFFLNFSMAACKAIMDAAHGIPMSTVVTAIARNGVEAGIRISGLGDQWFTAPSSQVKGIMFPPFTPDDANPDIGDSTITETCGIGAFAMAAAPAMVKLVGGTVADAINFTRLMGEITVGENPHYTIPYLNFAGTPTGIDIRKVAETGICPKINTGIAHREFGHGIVGAGITEIPLGCFTAALKEFANSLKS